jgi:hypothetical protein
VRHARRLSDGGARTGPISRTFRRPWQEALRHAVITTTTMYAHFTTRRKREKLAEYLK